jgi:5-dehydro-4-deoxyglucarate dehydratase
MTFDKNRYRGCFGFPVTPFHEDLSLDLASLEQNVDLMARHSFCSLVASGGTGELYSLTPDEAVAVVEVSVKATNGRMPIVGGVGFNTPIAVDLAKRMAKAGAEAILILPPYYSNAPMEGLFAYYEAVGKATDLPLAIYSRDWAVFKPEDVARLADRVPTLQIWKDGQGNIRQYQRIISTVGDRLAWVGGLGDDCCTGYWSIGVQAYTSSISNIAPVLALEMAKCGAAADFKTLNELMQRHVHPLYALRERVRGYEVTVMKKAMDLLGQYGGPVRPPLCPMTAPDIAALQTLLKGYPA